MDACAFGQPEERPCFPISLGSSLLILPVKFGMLLFSLLVSAFTPIAAHFKQIFTLQACVWMVAALKKCATQHSPVC